MEVKTKTGSEPFKTQNYKKTISSAIIPRVRYDPAEFARADRSAVEKALAAIIQNVFKNLQASPAVAALPLRTH